LNFATAGVGSTLPAGSIASTLSLCLPSFSFFAGRNGELHGWNGLKSSWHWKLDPASLEAKLKLGLRFRVFFGPPVIVVSGAALSAGAAGAAGGPGAGWPEELGVLSTYVTEELEQGEALLAPSIAVARKVVVLLSGTDTVNPGPGDWKVA
jgi:hypothetical protein